MTISEAIEELEKLRGAVATEPYFSANYTDRTYQAVSMGIEALKRCRAYNPPKKVVLDEMKIYGVCDD